MKSVNYPYDAGALLRAIEYGEVRRVGSAEAFTVNVRIIAATNRDLDAEVKAGRFREDLLHRLNVDRFESNPFANEARISGSWTHLLKSFRRQGER